MYQKEGGRTARCYHVPERRWTDSQMLSCTRKKVDGQPYIHQSGITAGIKNAYRRKTVCTASEELYPCTAFQKNSPCVQPFRRTLPVYSVSEELSLCTAFKKNSPCVQHFRRDLPVYSISEELSLCTAFQKNSPRVQRFRRTLPVYSVSE